MIKETITQIEARIEKAESLNDAKKKELLDLLSTLKIEVSELSKTHAEQSRSITGFTEVSIHEAIREEKNPQLLKLSLEGLSTSVQGFREFSSEARRNCQFHLPYPVEHRNMKEPLPLSLIY